MSQITVTVTGVTPQEVKAKLRKLADSFEAGSHGYVAPPPAVPTDAPPSPEPAPAVEDAVPTTETAPAPDVPTVDLPTLRTLLVELNQAGKNEQIKQLLAKYGADRLSGVAPEDYGALYTDAQELAAS